MTTIGFGRRARGRVLAGWGIAMAAVLAAGQPVGAAEREATPATARTFAPAFAADNIDAARCFQYVDGAPEQADAWRVQRALGLVGTLENWQHHIWEMPAGETGQETTFGFLVVLRKPVAIGTLSVSPADLAEPKGSVNGGELFYVTGDAAVVPEVADEAAWTKVAFAAPAQHLRFGTLPKGTLVKALYYKDVRKKGPAQLIYLNAYKARLNNVTSLASGLGAPAEGARDPAGLIRGTGWSVEPAAPVSEAAPASYTLVWTQKQPLNGVFLYSNADKYRLLTFDGAAADVATAPATAWKVLQASADWDNLHGWESWHYFYRWLSFPVVEASALKVEMTAVDGKTPWITGLGAMTVVGD